MWECNTYGARTRWGLCLGRGAGFALFKRIYFLCSLDAITTESNKSSTLIYSPSGVNAFALSIQAVQLCSTKSTMEIRRSRAAIIDLARARSTTITTGAHCDVILRAHDGLPSSDGRSDSFDLSLSPSPRTQTSQWKSSISCTESFFFFFLHATSNKSSDFLDKF